MKPIRIYLYDFTQEELDKIIKLDVNLSKAVNKILTEYLNNN